MTRPYRHAPRSVYMMERAARAHRNSRIALVLAGVAASLALVSLFGPLV